MKTSTVLLSTLLITAAVIVVADYVADNPAYQGRINRLADAIDIQQDREREKKQTKHYIGYVSANQSKPIYLLRFGNLKFCKLFNCAINNFSDAVNSLWVQNIITVMVLAIITIITIHICK